MANIFEINRPNNKIILGTTGTTIVITPFTASKPLALNANKELESITIGTSLDYTRPTLNTVQDIRTTASPEFVGLTLSGNLTMPDGGWIGRSSSHCIQFNDTQTEIRHYSQFLTGIYEGNWNTVELFNYYNAVGYGAGFQTHRARGTIAAPTIVINGDTVGNITARGYDGANWRSACKIYFYVDGTPESGVSVPGRIGFDTTTLGDTSTHERMTITSTGKVGIGTVWLAEPTELLEVNGNIDTTGVIKVDSIQVLGNRIIDVRCDDAINSGDAITDGVIDSLRDAMITHGLIAAS